MPMQLDYLINLLIESNKIHGGREGGLTLVNKYGLYGCTYQVIT